MFKTASLPKKENEDLQEGEYCGLMTLARSLFSKTCTLYRLQIEVLNRFFSHAKASLTAIGKNIKDVREKKVVTDRIYASGHKSITGHISSFNRASKSIDLESDNIEEIKDLLKKMNDCGNDLSRFGEYTNYRNKFCELTKINPKSVINPGRIFEANSSHKYKISMLPDNKKPIKLLNTQKLYHTSANPDLKELSGRYMFTMTKGNNYFYNPRVYFSIGTAIAANGTIYKDSMTKDGITIDGKHKKLYKYTPEIPIRTVYRDQEFSEGGACYVEARNPIKVKRLN